MSQLFAVVQDTDNATSRGKPRIVRLTDGRNLTLAADLIGGDCVNGQNTAGVVLADAGAATPKLYFNASSPDPTVGSLYLVTAGVNVWCTSFARLLHRSMH